MNREGAWEWLSLRWIHEVRAAQYRATSRLPVKDWLRRVDAEEAAACLRVPRAEGSVRRAGQATKRQEAGVRVLARQPEVVPVGDGPDAGGQGFDLAARVRAEEAHRGGLGLPPGPAQESDQSLRGQDGRPVNSCSATAGFQGRLA